MSEQKVPRSVEQRIVIKFLIGENVPSAEIHHRLQQQYGEECLRSYSCSLNHSYIYRQLMQQWLVLSITRKERNKQHTTGKQYSCYTDLQNKHNGTVCVLILTTPLAPFLTGHLWGYFTSNAMTTFDRPSIPGILEVCSGVSLYKI